MVVVAAAIAGLAWGSAGSTTLISRAAATSGGDPAAGADSIRPAISTDGRYVAFQSGADNLSSVDDNSQKNVFLRDTKTFKTILISRASGAGGVAADGDSIAPSISADGRYVAFASKADNLSSADDHGVPTSNDVFVRDLKRNRTILVSRKNGAHGAGASAPAGVQSFAPAISADGRRVAFTSSADNLAAGDDNDTLDVFVRDLRKDRTTLVSAASDGGVGDDLSSDPAISADGKHVAFDSSAHNLVATPTSSQEVFERDLGAAKTRLISRHSGRHGQPGNDSSYAGGASRDGRFVVFDSEATNLSGADGNSDDSFIRDTKHDRTILLDRAADGTPVSGSAVNPTITPDGRYVAFEAFGTGLPGLNGTGQQVEELDRKHGTTRLISRQDAADGGAPGDGISGSAAISDNGRRLAFTSDADNLSRIDDNAVNNVFLRDVLGRR